MDNYTDNTSKNQGYSGVLPNICIKCKRTDVELTTFNYRTFKRKGSLWWNNQAQILTETMEYPICTSCRPEIERQPRIIIRLFSELLSDENYKQEVRTKVSDDIDTLKAQAQISFYCPKCGSQRTALDDFCNSCGKDLRKLKKDLNSKK